MNASQQPDDTDNKLYAHMARLYYGVGPDKQAVRQTESDEQDVTKVTNQINWDPNRRLSPLKTI